MKKDTTKWLLKNHPKETSTDWIKCLEQGIINGINIPLHISLHVWFQVSQNQKALKTAQCTVTVRCSQQSDITLEEEGDATEQLYQKRFKEGYDICDEEYVKWLMINHPNDVPSEWLTEASSSSMMPATTTASQPDKSTKSDKIVLNPRKRLQAYNTKPGGPRILELNTCEKKTNKQKGGRGKGQKRWQPLRNILA